MGERDLRQLRYLAESGGYSVMEGERFIGRVTRSRGRYEHSNGRTYRFWSWAAFPVLQDGTFNHKTRSAAGAYLREKALAARE